MNPPPSREPEASEFYATAVVGWREWDVSSGADGEPSLQSLYGAIQIDGVAPMRTLVMSEHEGVTHPGWNCSCGIWARSEENPPERQAMVWGEVSLWGEKVIRYSKGYRAQYAYPKRLYVNSSLPALKSNPAEAQRLADRLAEAYGVPCEVKERESAEVDLFAPGPMWPSRNPLLAGGISPPVGAKVVLTDPSGTQTPYIVAHVAADGTISLA